MKRRAIVLLIALVVAACGSPLPRGQQPRVAFTSQQAIGLQLPGGAVHVYRYRLKRD